MAEITAEREISRTDVASYLHEFAEQLADRTERTERTDRPERTPSPDPTDVEGHGHDGRVTFVVGNDSATINPPETVNFDVTVGADSSLVGDGTRESVVFELSWNTEEIEENDEFRIE